MTIAQHLADYFPKLRYRLARAQIPEAVLAERTGLGPAHLSRIMTGGVDIRLSTLLKIDEAATKLLGGGR